MHSSVYNETAALVQPQKRFSNFRLGIHRITSIVQFHLMNNYIKMLMVMLISAKIHHIVSNYHKKFDIFRLRSEPKRTGLSLLILNPMKVWKTYTNSTVQF